MFPVCELANGRIDCTNVELAKRRPDPGERVRQAGAARAPASLVQGVRIKRVDGRPLPRGTSALEGGEVLDAGEQGDREDNDKDQLLRDCAFSVNEG